MPRIHTNCGRATKPGQAHQRDVGPEWLALLGREPSVEASRQRGLEGPKTFRLHLNRVVVLPLTVREWLRGQSYEAQRAFGLLALNNIRTGVW